MNVALGIMQAQIDRRVLTNAVNIQNKFKIIATTDDILKIQKVDGEILYDAFELSFNPVDKTSILKNNNIDIVQSINNNAVSADVYNKTQIDTALNLKSDKSDTYPKAEINTAIISLQASIDRKATTFNTFTKK